MAPIWPFEPRDYLNKSPDETILALSPEGPRGPVAPAWPDKPLKPGSYLVHCKVYKPLPSYLKRLVILVELLVERYFLKCK